MLALPGQDAWIAPELLEDEELEDDELDEDELEDELDEDELEDDEEPEGVPPPQPLTANNANAQVLAIASFAVYTLFMQPLAYC